MSPNAITHNLRVMIHNFRRRNLRPAVVVGYAVYATLCTSDQLVFRGEAGNASKMYILGVRLVRSGDVPDGFYQVFGECPVV